MMSHKVLGALFQPVFAGFLLLASQLVAAETLQDLLERMAMAGSHHNYTGYFVYVSGNQVSSMKLIHGVRDGVEYERMIHLSGNYSEIIKRGDELICILPDKVTHLVETNLAAAPLERALERGQLLQNTSYDIRLGDQERVADKVTRKLSVLPRDHYRYAYDLWVEPETGLVMKSVTRDGAGKVMEVMEFVQVSLDHNIDFAEFEPDIPDHEIEKSRPLVAQQADQEGLDKLRIGWLPTGFESADSAPQASGRENGKIFSDGFAAVTVFVEAVNQKDDTLMSRMGPTVAMTRYLQGNGQWWKVTVVGEVPEETIRKVIASVSMND